MNKLIELNKLGPPIQVVQSCRSVQKKGAIARSSKEHSCPKKSVHTSMDLVCWNWGVAPSLPLHGHFICQRHISLTVTVGGRERKQLDKKQRVLCGWHEAVAGR